MGLLPGVAHAHDYENPGFNGARLFVDTSSLGNDEVPSSSTQQPVKGKDFAPNQHVEVFQCPSSAPTDPRTDCQPAGAALTDATGYFEANVAISAWMPTKSTYCAHYGPSQCYEFS